MLCHIDLLVHADVRCPLRIRIKIKLEMAEHAVAEAALLRQSTPPGVGLVGDERAQQRHSEQQNGEPQNEQRVVEYRQRTCRFRHGQGEQADRQGDGTQQSGKGPRQPGNVHIQIVEAPAAPVAALLDLREQVTGLLLVGIKESLCTSLEKVF